MTAAVETTTAMEMLCEPAPATTSEQEPVPRDVATSVVPVTTTDTIESAHPLVVNTPEASACESVAVSVEPIVVNESEEADDVTAPGAGVNAVELEPQPGAATANATTHNARRTNLGMPLDYHRYFFEPPTWPDF